MRTHYFGPREQQIEHLRGKGWRFATMKNAPVLIGWHREKDSEKCSAKAWTFKADRPAFYYGFRHEAQMRDHIARFVAGVKSTADYRAQRDADRKAARCQGVAAVYAKAAREGYITATETAVCLRTVLAVKFPGVKFSVRSDTCLRVSWTDGPRARDVEAIASQYAGEGFDGSIDLRHQIQRWLAPDGSMSLAHDSGTVSSMGYAPEVIGSAHRPDAVLVRPGTDFVFCERRLSESARRDLCRRVCHYYGVPMPHLASETDLMRFINATSAAGEALGTLIHRLTNGTLEIPA